MPRGSTLPSRCAASRRERFSEDGPRGLGRGIQAEQRGQGRGHIGEACAGFEGALEIVDGATLQVKKTIPVNGRLHNVYVTPDNKYVITGSLRSQPMTKGRR